MITQQQLKDLLSYDPITGHFTWLEKLSLKGKPYKRSHTRAGSVNTSGYRVIFFNAYGTLREHRLAVLYMTGSMPTTGVDHIDQNTQNNSWSNLRQADQETNCKNRRRYKTSRTGVTGVTITPNGSYLARIQHDSKEVRLGLFESLQEATSVRKAAEKQFGYHPNHGAA